MTDLTKFIEGEVFNWDRTQSVILLNEGEYDGYTYTSELDDEIYGPGKADDIRYTEEGFAKFRAWCEQHSVHLYADEKHNFFIQKGVEEAIKAGRRYLLAENLS